jgi:hypothetical protein
MFATELDMFSLGTITILIHTKLVPKLVYIPDIVIVGPIPKHQVKLVGVLAVKLAIPPDIIK